MSTARPQSGKVGVPEPYPVPVLAPAPIPAPVQSLAPPTEIPRAPTLSQALELTERAEKQAVPRSTVRKSLAKRLSDVICIPASQLPPQERHMAGDVLVELLRDADISLRASVAKRLVMLNEAPRTILVILAKDEIEVARHVLENSKSLSDSDLIQIARKVTTEHRMMMAQRRHISDAVVDVLVEFLEEVVVEKLLRNKGANFSETAMQRILTVSRSHQPYVTLLAKRVETRPSHGLTMFWWADAKNRKVILHRFGVTRAVLQQSCADLYPQAAAEGWNDSAVRQALQFIERRQRNRAAMARSKFETLEDAIDQAEQAGMSRKLADEISYIAGIKPATGAQILSDKTGEALAILCKAPGLRQKHIKKLWRALKRPETMHDGSGNPLLENAIAVYESISTDNAQTVLRYWNWSLTSSLTPEVLQYIKRGVIPKEEDFGAAAITAALVFGNRK